MQNHQSVFGNLSPIVFGVSVPPRMDKEIRDQKVDKGEQFKIKVPFSGTGPFEFKVKANGKELKDGDRIKISPFDDYVTLAIKGTVLCCASWLLALLAFY